MAKKEKEPQPVYFANPILRKVGIDMGEKLQKFFLYIVILGSAIAWAYFSAH